MLESKQTSINVRQKLSYPWLHIFSQVFCSSSRLLKIRGIFGIYALLILSDISLFSTKYMINFAEMSFYVNNENALCIFLFLFYLEGEQVFVQLQVQGTLSLQLVFVIFQSFFSLDNISSNSINYISSSQFTMDEDVEISDIGDMLSKNGFIEGGWGRWLCWKFHHQGDFENLSR